MAVQSLVPGWSDLSLVRPLLSASKTDILEYCIRHGLVPIEDESNSDTSFLRNRIRHEVFPLLEKINPQIKQSLTRVADVLQAGR